MKKKNKSADRPTQIIFGHVTGNAAFFLRLTLNPFTNLICASAYFSLMGPYFIICIHLLQSPTLVICCPLYTDIQHRLNVHKKETI